VIAPLIVFVFDSRERWFPVGVEESLGATRVRAPRDFPVEGLARRHPGDPRALDFSPGMTQSELPPVGYLWVVRSAGLAWHQVHLWSLYNPGPPAFQDHGRHEGDWEMAQVGCDPHDGAPLLVTLSQHAQGAKREWWACEVGERSGRPFVRVYVALGSHAMHFTPGRHGADVCDGRGRHVTPDLREPGPWWRWPGRWGNSAGVGGSPRSPGLQRGLPHDFHQRAAPG
jgi:hypothetical protein